MTNFKQAIYWMKQGKQVRRKSWRTKDTYLYLKGYIRCNKGTAYFFPEHFLADDWEIYEPKIDIKNILLKVQDKDTKKEGYISMEALLNEFLETMKESVKEEIK